MKSPIKEPLESPTNSFERLVNLNTRHSNASISTSKITPQKTELFNAYKEFSLVQFQQSQVFLLRKDFL